MQGFSTLELILAYGLFAAVLASTLLTAMTLPQSIENGLRQISVLSLDHIVLTASLQEARYGFENIHSATTTLGSVDIFSNVIPFDAHTKKILPTSYWLDLAGHTHSVSALGLSADPNYFPDCSRIVRGDWENPRVITRALAPGDLLPLILPATIRAITSLSVNSHMLIGIASSTTAKTDPSLFLFSISSTTAPTYVGSIDNASSTKIGVSSVVATSTYLYAASAVTPDFSTCLTGSACSQLQVFDIHDPTAPQLISNITLSTSTPPYTLGNNGQSSGKSITYENGRIYLGLAKGTATTQEFNILSTEDPVHPQWLGGFHIGRSITKIIIRDDLAYLATDDPLQELIVLDVHDPAHISKVASYDAPGNQIYGYGRDLDISGDHISLGRTYSPDGPEFSLLSLASSTPVLVSSVDLGNPQQRKGVEGVFLKDFLAVLLTNTSIAVWDIYDPSHPTVFTHDISFPGTGLALACANNTLYATSLSNSQGYLTIVTSS
jgi:hypothetical protein